METYKLETVLKEEKEILEERRRRLFGEKAAADLEKNKFGIAMSGGGIRSATINLGFLKTLNLFKILEKADYISTVSGGGYTGAYLQATIKEEKGYDELFERDKTDRLQEYGDYLIPGQGKWEKLWNTVLLTFGFLVSWIMSLLSPAVLIIIIYLVFKSIASLPFLQIGDVLLDWDYKNNKVMDYLGPALCALGGVMALHFFANLIFNFNLIVSKIFTQIESAMALIILAFLGLVGILTVDTRHGWSYNEIGWSLLAALGLYLAGFILNPNSLSFHRFYRTQLADAFLRHTTKCRNLLLKDVFRLDGEHHEYLAPYPLINTCLNLQNPGGNDKFKGAKASDYFLLSPRWCGSKLSNFVKTNEFPGYKHMTLPAALTISAAAVNPGMGIYSNKLLSVLMTLFNARLGFWVNNPSVEPRKILPQWTNFKVWWPSFFFKELFSKIGTDNRKLNISDGGHIENLAVYELLRRECRLILAVDAGADPLSTFADLENLAIRARNELGIDICFRPNQDPVDIIRPKASSGYAQKRFAIADLMRVWEEFSLEGVDGEPIFFTKRIVEYGKIVEKKECLEVLVNYFYSKNDRNMLKYRVDLKAQRGVDFSESEYDYLQKKAARIVGEKLERQSSLKGSDKIKIGTLVYIKSSVTSPRKWYVPEYESGGQKNPQFDTFKYKIYHPEFPHESTADQFFDPVQWSSYFQLGQYIATDVLSAPKQPNEYRRGDHDFNIDDLIAFFDGGQPLFKGNDMAEVLLDASEKPQAKPQPMPATVSKEPPVEIHDASGPEMAGADSEVTPPPPPEQLVVDAEEAEKPQQTAQKIEEEMQFKI